MPNMEWVVPKNPAVKPYWRQVDTDGIFVLERQPNKLEYHKSWDWLMPVVNKIYLSRDVEDVTIRPGLTTIKMVNGATIKSPHKAENDSITECWLAVTEYIQNIY